MKIRRLFPLAVLFIALPAPAQQLLVSSAAIEPPVKLEKIDTPRPKADRRIFWAGVSALAASKTADAITTRRSMNRGGWENNPIFGSHPTPARQAGINAAFFASQVGVFYLTEHSRNHWIRWTGRTYIGLVSANHIDLAVQNAVNTGTSRSSHPLFPF